MDVKKVSTSRWGGGLWR